jgi:type I restriction enzyme S subunit
MTASDLVRFRLKRGDLLVCEGGEVGRAAIWKDELKECYYQKALHRLRPLKGYSPELMLLWLHFWTARDLLANYVSQTSIAHLTCEKLSIVPLASPDAEEQKQIIEAMMSLQSRIDVEADNQAKFGQTKTGLIDDLLTGRVRVTDFIQDEA